MGRCTYGRRKQACQVDIGDTRFTQYSYSKRFFPSNWGFTDIRFWFADIKDSNLSNSVNTYLTVEAQELRQEHWGKGDPLKRLLILSDFCWIQVRRSLLHTFTSKECLVEVANAASLSQYDLFWRTRVYRGFRFCKPPPCHVAQRWQARRY